MYHFDVASSLPYKERPLLHIANMIKFTIYENLPKPLYVYGISHRHARDNTKSEYLVLVVNGHDALWVVYSVVIGNRTIRMHNLN